MVVKERDGFTLVEVLIALTILGVAIVAIIKLFPDSLRQARVAAERTVVAQLANSRMGQVRSGGADTLLQRQPDYLTLKAAEQNQSLMYQGYGSSVQHMRGTDETYLQRVTFTVKMPDGRVENFVTYVAKQ
jgi:uncharacterized protein (TIGR02598 family)